MSNTRDCIGVGLITAISTLLAPGRALYPRFWRSTAGWAMLGLASHGATGCVRWLLRLGMRVDEPDPMAAGTPLMHAARFGQLGTMQLLLDCGADVHARSEHGRTALMEAAAEGRTDALALLLDSGARLEDGDQLGWTALTLAAQHGQVAAMQVLKDRGADLDAGDVRGRTALLWAKALGQDVAAQWLTEAGARPLNAAEAAAVASVHRHSRN